MGKRLVQIEIEGSLKDGDILVYNSQLKCYKPTQKAAIFAYQDNKIKALENLVHELQELINEIDTNCNEKINKLAISIKTLNGGEEQWYQNYY